MFTNVPYFLTMSCNVYQCSVLFCTLKVVHTFEVPHAVKQYMAKPVDQIVFEFFNPTDALAILVTMSPLAAEARNLQLFARHTEWYEDFSDGARMHRVQNAIPPGTAALSSILFFDGINRDVKGKCYTMS